MNGAPNLTPTTLPTLLSIADSTLMNNQAV
jgi:hypothetical protein